MMLSLFLPHLPLFFLLLQQPCTPIFPVLYNIDHTPLGGQQATYLCQLPIPFLSPVQELSHLPNSYIRLQLYDCIPVHYNLYLYCVMPHLPLHQGHHGVGGKAADWKGCPLACVTCTNNSRGSMGSHSCLLHVDSFGPAPPSPSLPSRFLI